MQSYYFLISYIFRTDRKRDNRRNDFISQGGERQQRDRNMSPIPAKRRSGVSNENPKSVFSRLSGPPNRDNDKPRIQSRVIREMPSRQEIVAGKYILALNIISISFIL